MKCESANAEEASIRSGEQDDDDVSYSEGHSIDDDDDDDDDDDSMSSSYLDVIDSVAYEEEEEDGHHNGDRSSTPLHESGRGSSDDYDGNDDETSSRRDQSDYDIEDGGDERSFASSRTSGSSNGRSRSNSSHSSRSASISNASGRRSSNSASSHTSDATSRRSTTSESDLDGLQSEFGGDNGTSSRKLRSIDETSEQEDSLDQELTELVRGVSATSGSIFTYKTNRQDDETNSRDISRSRRRPDGSVSSRRQVSVSQSSRTTASEGSDCSSSGHGSTSRSSRKRDDGSRTRSSHSHSDDDNHRETNSNKNGSNNSRSSSSRDNDGSIQNSTLLQHIPAGGRQEPPEARGMGSQGFNDEEGSRGSFASSRRSEGSKPLSRSTSSNTSHKLEGSFSSRTHSNSNEEEESALASVSERSRQERDNLKRLVEEGSSASSHHGSVTRAHQQQQTKIPNEESSVLQGGINDDDGRVRSLAVLGTMSDAGKSVIAAAICRILVNGGTRVAPFKAQNMSNNASPALLPDPDRRERLYRAFERAVGVQQHHVAMTTMKEQQGYGEIGTAQSLQAVRQNRFVYSAARSLIVIKKTCSYCVCLLNCRGRCALSTGSMQNRATGRNESSLAEVGGKE
jgi:hypothetical protein